MAKTLKENLEAQEKITEKALENARKALKSNERTQYAKAMSVLNEAVKEQNEIIKKIAYSECLSKENPMIEAVKMFYVDLEKVQESKDKNDGYINGINLQKTKRRIDLEKFCEFGSLPTEWAKDTSMLLQLLTLREIDVYRIKPDELAKKSYFFINAVSAKKAGETPDSNTKIVKLLQKIIDEAIFVDDGTGKNAYKCTNHDIAFIHDAVTKFDAKEKCALSTMNDRQFKMVMASVFAHCLGEAYKVVAKAKLSKEA